MIFSKETFNISFKLNSYPNYCFYNNNNDNNNNSNNNNNNQI